MKKPSETAPETSTENAVEENDELNVPPLLQLLLEQHAAMSEHRLPSRIEGIVVGRVLAVQEGGAAQVCFPGTPVDGVNARAMVTLEDNDVNSEVAVMFEASDSTRPVIMGRIVTPSISAEGQPYTAQSDGRHLDISATDKIVLRCGDASITLSRDGKIELCGKYVLSRSEGVNRIQGGAIELN